MVLYYPERVSNEGPQMQLPYHVSSGDDLVLIFCRGMLQARQGPLRPGGSFPNPFLSRIISQKLSAMGTRG